MERKADKIWVGLLMGLLLPFLVMLIVYLSSYAYLTVPDFLRKMAFQAVFLKLLSLCAIVNLASFFLFYQTKHDRAARGVIFATFIYAFVVLINKFSGTLI
ncbi:MAG: hypothetical protein CMP59_06145 [Flavobacteriales bacterium]|nr:hypothetical protein [Flavobacteriales bacterium]|tara:strand:- start:1690 stop:1992 length:303 start_codon:yes stop_codon:yes gene_type:complete